MQEANVLSLGKKIKRHGRHYAAGSALYLSYSGSGIEFEFYGTLLLVEFVSHYGKEYIDLPTSANPRWRKTWPIVAITCDGQTRRCELNSEQVFITVLKEAEPGPHRIQIRKCTENYKTYVGVKNFAFEGSITDYESAGGRKLSVIGDSITCGFGAATEGTERGVFYSSEEDSTKTYWYLLAERLCMDAESLCLSGITLSKHEGYLSAYSIEELFPYEDRILEDHLGITGEHMPHDFLSSPSEYVIVNIGTNDAFAILFCNEPNGEANFEAKYLDFLENLRAVEPKAYIICCLGPMNHYLYDNIKSAVQRWQALKSDQRITCMKFLPMDPRKGIGAAGHPNEDAHRAMADELYRLIKGLES